jgi:ferredoxin--NADP+ reductase
VFRFGVTPTEVVGTQRAEGLRVVPTGEPDCAKVIDASLILTAIVYHADPVSGVPYDAARGVVTNNAGRVVDDTGTVVPVCTSPAAHSRRSTCDEFPLSAAY